MPKSIRLYLSGLLILVWVLLAILPWQTWISGDMDLTSMLQGPSSDHPFGTDSLGRDLLLNFVNAIRESVVPLWINILAACLLGYSTGFVLLLGQDSQRMLAPFSWLLQLVGGVFLSIPIGIFVFLLAHYLERAGIWSIIGALSAFSYFRSLLLIFELYTQDEKLGYWKAHRSIGGGLGHRLWHYGICRNWRTLLLGNLAFNLSMAISIEAALSYLGFGVQPPKLSFGNILSAHYDQFLKGHLSIMFFTVGGLALCYLFPVALMKVLSSATADKFDAEVGSISD